jgi:death on curing protein
VPGPTSNRSTYVHRGWRFPTVRAVVDLHDRILAASAGRPGVRDLGLLESALSKPVESAFRKDAYEGLFRKAAAVGFSITQNHVFTDANKRTGLLTMLFILHENRVKANPSDDAASTLMVLIATGNLSIEGVRAVLLHWGGESPSSTDL